MVMDFGGPIGAWTPGRPRAVADHLTEPQWLGFHPGISTIGVHPGTGELLLADLYRGRILILVRRESVMIAPAEVKPPVEVAVAVSSSSLEYVNDVVAVPTV